MIEAPVSGTSLNAARSAAPALLVPLFRDQWVYFVAPIAGALIAVSAYKGRWGGSTVCAKLYHTPKYACPYASCGYRLVRAGETVMREGEQGSEAYLVELGALEVRRIAAGGREITIAVLGPGDWVGELSLLLDEPRSVTVVASTDAQLRRVPNEAFGQVLAQDPRRTQELLRQLARRVRDASARVAEGA